jgi:hypothetical protein
MTVSHEMTDNRIWCVWFAGSDPKGNEFHPEMLEPGETIAVRIVQVRDAVVSIIDPTGHRKPWRVFSPWVSERRLRRVSPWERDLATQAYETREEVRGDELCYAVPLLDGETDEHRVIVVCELEQLSLRL